MPKAKLPSGKHEKLQKRAVEKAIELISDGRPAEELKAYLHDGDMTTVYLMRAEIAYLTDPRFRSLEYFYPLMRGTMSLAQFIAEAEGDQWESKRERIKAQARSELVRRVSSQIVTDQVREAEQVQQLRGWLFSLLTPAIDDEGNPQFKVRPKSLEGCIKVFKEVSILLQMYRQTFLQQIEPHAPQVIDEDQAARGPFTDEEAGQIAEQLLRKRFLKE